MSDQVEIYKFCTATVSSIILFFLCSSIYATFVAGPEIDLAGSSLHLDHKDIWVEMDYLSRFIYEVGDYLCPQEAARSWHIQGRQMPFCIRDTVIAIGTIIGGIVALILDSSDRWMLRVGLFLTPLTYIDWVFKALTHIDFMPVMIITGILSGIGLLIVFYTLLKRICDGSNVSLQSFFN